MKLDRVDSLLTEMRLMLRESESYPMADPDSPIGFMMGTLPEAPFYVTATDDFFSGWGPAKNMDNVVVFPCQDRAEAKLILGRVKKKIRADDARISSSPPKPKAKTVYTVMEKNGRASSWYKPER